MSDTRLPFHALPANPYWPVTIDDACDMMRAGLAGYSDDDLSNPGFKIWNSENLFEETIAKFGLDGRNTPLLFALGGAEIPAGDAARILIGRTRERCTGPGGVPPLRPRARIRFRRLFRYHALENANQILWEAACAVRNNDPGALFDLHGAATDWIHLVMPTNFPVDHDRIQQMLLGYIPDLTTLDWQLVLGLVLVSMGESEFAQVPLRAVITRDPSIETAWGALIVCHERSHEYPEMIELISAALAIQPANDKYWTMLGLAYYAVDMWREALDAYEHSLAINPANHAAWNNKGEALLRFNRLPEAIACFDKSASLRSGDPEQYRLRGDAYFRLGKYHIACTNYAIAAAQNDRLARTYFEFVGCRLRAPISPDDNADDAAKDDTDTISSTN